MQRRALMSGGLVAGVSALLASDVAESAPAIAEDDQTAAAVAELRRSLERQVDPSVAVARRAMAQIREQQRVWLRSAHKFPDYIEVGVSVWEGIYDWHVQHLQPISIARMPDGRYGMVFMFTTLLLRPDQPADFVGYPFDVDAQGRPVTR